MLRSKGALRDCLLCVVILLLVTDLVSAFSKAGETCYIGENLRGVCARLEDCETGRTFQHQNYLCTSEDEDSVCCREPEQRNLRNKLVRNVFEFAESQGSQFVDAETIYDVKEAIEETNISDRKKHSISISTYNRKHTNSDDYTRNPIAEPNQLQPGYVQEHSNAPTGKRDNSNFQSIGYNSQRKPQIYNSRETNKNEQNGNDEQYSTFGSISNHQYAQNSGSAVPQMNNNRQSNKHKKNGNDEVYSSSSKPQYAQNSGSSLPQIHNNNNRQSNKQSQNGNDEPYSFFGSPSPKSQYVQNSAQINNNRQTNKHKQNGNEQLYSTSDYTNNRGSTPVPYGEAESTNANQGRPHRKPQDSYVEPLRPPRPTTQRTTERHHYYDTTTIRPSTTKSPWQEAPRPLIEDENGYPVPPPPKRPQTSRPTHRPKPFLKRISEVKCKEYSEIVTETVAGLPLTTDPKPVEINVQKCNYNAHQLIVGGQNASVGEFPHMAAVGFLDRKRRTINWNCGGSLISEHFVLTAAHCTTSSLGWPTVVRLGEHNLVRGDDGAHPVDYLVKEVIKPREYQPPIRYNDIALLRLSRPVTFTPQIRPACLYSKSSISNQKTIATGWGRIDYAEDQSDVLLKVVLSIVSNQKCNELYQGESKTEVLSKGIVAQQICAGELSGGKDTCQGDSGGPIEITTQGNKCIHHVIGVTSFGKRCAQANAPGVYTRVSSYLTWIEGVVWPDLVHALQTNHSYPQS